MSLFGAGACRKTVRAPRDVVGPTVTVNSIPGIPLVEVIPDGGPTTMSAGPPIFTVRFVTPFVLSPEPKRITVLVVPVPRLIVVPVADAIVPTPKA